MGLAICKMERTFGFFFSPLLGTWGQGVSYVICDVFLARWSGVPVGWGAWMGLSGDRAMGEGSQGPKCQEMFLRQRGKIHREGVPYQDHVKLSIRVRY